MAITDPAKIEQVRITSVDIVSFDAGLDQRGQESLRPNNFSRGYNTMINSQGLATYRYVLQPFLPNTEETVYQVYPVLKDDGKIRYVTADNGKIKWIDEGGSAWAVMAGDNVTTGSGVVTTFLRVVDRILIMNGTDNLGYIDMKDWTVKHYDEVPNPANAPTLVRKTLTSGSFNVYYSITWNGQVSQTANSPIATISNNKIREQWLSASEGVTITRNNTAPAGATGWNLWVSTSASGVSIENSDMLPLALGLDLATTEFLDNGTLEVNLGAGTAPDENGTKGPKAKYGIEQGGRPFLFGNPDSPYSVYIGGQGDKAYQFNSDVGGYEMVLNDGTNYYPMSVVGFRNGQGVPGLTVLFSNTEGISKQAIIEPTTTTFGSQTFVVWTATEQNYGSAGVASPYGVVNYRGALRFPTADGMVRMDTKQSLQNVLSTERISDPIEQEVGTIKTGLLPQVVGAAWDNKVIWTAPTRLSDTNNTLIVADVGKSEGNEAWQLWDIACQWVGVVSPKTEPSFFYICKGNQILKLEKSKYAKDVYSDGTTEDVAMDVQSALVGLNTQHNGYIALVQAVFYLLDAFGEVELHVNYRDYYSGEIVTVSETFDFGDNSMYKGNGWSNPDFLYNAEMPTPYISWGSMPHIFESASIARTRREKLKLQNVVTNEMSGRVVVKGGDNSVTVKAISFEGKSLGINPDVRS